MPLIPPRWTSGHLVALVELVCGVGGAGWLIASGIEAEAAGSAGRSWLDRSILFVAGAAVGVVLVGWAVRSWRAANREPPPPPPVASRGPVPPPAPPPPPTIPVPLSPEGERELVRVVAVLAAAGVLAPEAPEPEHLREAVADFGEPVTADGVLVAIGEADFYRPEFRVSRYVANLALHASHVEQDAGGLHGQAEDIRRLAGTGLADVSVAVEIGTPAGTGRVPTRLRVRAGGGDPVVVEYAGAVKYLSTELHVALARVLRERATGRRLAWLWCDQGVWLSVLPDGGVERLNAALGPAAGEGWAWVDEEPPMAAGDMYPG